MSKKYLSDYPQLLDDQHQSKTRLYVLKMSLTRVKKCGCDALLLMITYGKPQPTIEQEISSPRDVPFAVGPNQIMNKISILSPELLEEWNWTKNSGLNLKHLIAGSNREVWQVYTERHEFKKKVYQRGFRRWLQIL